MTRLVSGVVSIREFSLSIQENETNESTHAISKRSGGVAWSRSHADTVIEVGDLVYLDGDDAKPASSFPWTTNLATTQENFAEKFLGVAHQSSAEGEIENIK